MSQIIPIYIPTYINSAEYSPARVLPRLFFYNGMVECETYWIESGSANFGGVTFQQNAFPYFDNYNVVTGSFPSENSNSLLFTNETAAYGVTPNNSLYTNYWSTYINLLYNPKTRLLNCSAIIPLADYFKMELNDIVNFRGNYYHLRAINDYSLKTGECNLQLLGPLIPNTFSEVEPTPDCTFGFTSSLVTTTTSTTTTTLAPTTTTTTVAPTTTTTTIGESCISASLSGATTGTFTSGGILWNYIDLFSAGGSTITSTLSITSGYTPNAKLLLIGGGGAGAFSTSGGSYGNGGAGGAGQVTFINNLTLSSGSYPIQIGAGGAGVYGPPQSQGANGTPSIALGYTANGGGGGGGAFPTNNGRSVGGGSGGGAGAAGTGGTGTRNGGSNATNFGGGGGGGASANGTNGTLGIGGAGLSFNLTGTTIEVAGGGNGGTSTTGGGNAGSFGGGRGSRNTQAAQGGANGTGGGGGGGITVDFTTTSGGSGRLVIAWPSCNQPTTTTSTTTTSTTTTTTAGPSFVYRAVGCCDPSSSYYVGWTYTASAAIPATIYNPVADTCMTLVENVPSQSVSFTITAENRFSNVYGYGDEQCNRCAILGAHICSGSLCNEYTFQNINLTTTRSVYTVDCNGSSVIVTVPPSSSVTACSYPDPIAEVPSQIIITNLGLCP